VAEKKEKSLMAQRFRGFLPVVVDVETGGFNSSTDALLEIAMVTLRMDENGWLYPYEAIDENVIPFEGANLEKDALEFTGIDPFNPDRGAISEEEAMTKMLQFVRKEVKSTGCNRAVLVGHNAHFDHGFVKAAIERTDLKRDPFHPFSSFDTASLSALSLGQSVLAKSCITAEIEFDNKEAHSAVYDTWKTAELFCFIVNRWKELGGWPLKEHKGDAEDSFADMFS
jgi:ribonuclease T